VALAGVAEHGFYAGVVSSVDPRYVAARRVLLDALLALEAQADALIIAGAQAVYLHAGDGDLTVAPFTTDADLAVNPELLYGDPLLEAAMTGAGFQLALYDGHVEPGIWTTAVDVGGEQLLVLVVNDRENSPGAIVRIPHLGRGR